MAIFKQIEALDLLGAIQPGKPLLWPLIVASISRNEVRTGNSGADALLVASAPNIDEPFRFVLESKRRSVPQVLQDAVNRAKTLCRPGEFPLIQVPYLSAEKIADLEKQGVSGIDLCGNGIVTVPGRICVVRIGNPNRYPESRPLNNPYRGRSAMVARMLLSNPKWETLSSFAQALRDAGTNLSLPQVSKAVQALQEEMIVTKDSGQIRLTDRLRLIEKLAAQWKEPRGSPRQAVRLAAGQSIAAAFASSAKLRWAVTGSSSVSRYAKFSQGGPRRIAVSSLPEALNLLGQSQSAYPNLADVELMQTDEEGYYFANEVSPDGMRWASALQTWLELQSGDARQKLAAADLRAKLDLPPA